jgi:hypothetical protein
MTGVIATKLEMEEDSEEMSSEGLQLILSVRA